MEKCQNMDHFPTALRKMQTTPGTSGKINILRFNFGFLLKSSKPTWNSTPFWEPNCISRLGRRGAGDVQSKQFSGENIGLHSRRQFSTPSSQSSQLNCNMVGLHQQNKKHPPFMKLIAQQPSSSHLASVKCFKARSQRPPCRLQKAASVTHSH